ncbi:ArsR/SmtB family transcription factor [Sphaerisporangium corydalis]|uniref:ArsR/SmtB family transcription factor n=1 Tax=Sphaerisporangium corydalis TaxID=1441875 RepID=A0ABV9ERD4_9ACTN|nr:winged helix-turn-helix domain-containing protein [Sphaerisporangium corydalis]
MTRLRLSPIALSRSRFAVSPLAETLSCLIALHRGRSEPWIARWLARHQTGYRDWLADNEVAAGLLPLLAATKWLPDFVAVPPLDGVRTRLADELIVVAAHTDAEIAAMTGHAVAASWEPCDTDWLHLGGLGPRVAAMLDEGWARFVAPDWPRRRMVLERDIMHRAGLLAAYGWQHAIKDMTPTSAWVDDDAILFSHQEFPDRWIDEDGLIFVPHTPGGGSWTCERPPHYALVYPARGAAAGQDDGHPDVISRLLGSGRAHILRELTRPATSTQLAQVLDLSLGTVSAHLAVLRDAGVVAGSRAGRHVIYHLTDRGESLLTLLATRSR